MAPISPRPALSTPWILSLKRGETPTEAMLRDHLISVHRANAGFTERCARRCRDAKGRNSYEWLADVVEPDAPVRVLDLACGSGPLLELLSRTRPEARLTGVDMSADELALARKRLGSAPVSLHEGLAQDLSMLGRSSVDAVLCHWALTLMDPVAPVLDEVDRVLAPGGVFAAIIDGPADLSPIYERVNGIVYDWVQREYPLYGEHDLGDARVRHADGVAGLAAEAFPGAQLEVQPSVFSLHAKPDELAREAAGFYYAAFAVPEPAHSAMLAELSALFAAGGCGEVGEFAMPVNRLVVRR